MYNETLNKCILAFQQEVMKKYDANVNKYQGFHQIGKHFVSDGHSCNIFGQFPSQSRKLKNQTISAK